MSSRAAGGDPPRAEAAAVTPGRWPLLARRRVREREFWIVQALVVAVAAIHIGVEAAGLDQRLPVTGVVELAVVLHLVPVAYAGFRYGYEGSVLTGLWSGVLALPNVVLWHAEGYEWVGDLVFLGIVIGLGIVIAVPVERERRRRRREEERLRGYAREVLRAQERERARIARDLHDVVAQQLVLLTRRLDEHDPGADAGPAGQPRRLASEILDTVRRVSRGLRPAALEDLGLVPALRTLLDELGSRTGLATALNVEGEPRRIPEEAELTLYRIAQEALANAERHADPARVGVTVGFGREHVRLVVADDGRGFDAAAAGSGQERFGLLGMHERAELAGGSLEVTSAPGDGTRIAARIPAPARDGSGEGA